jgi:hypothetical protein
VEEEEEEEDEEGEEKDEEGEEDGDTMFTSIEDSKDEEPAAIPKGR